MVMVMVVVQSVKIGQRNTELYFPGTVPGIFSAFIDKPYFDAVTVKPFLTLNLKIKFSRLNQTRFFFKKILRN